MCKGHIIKNISTCTACIEAPNAALPNQMIEDFEALSRMYKLLEKISNIHTGTTDTAFDSVEEDYQDTMDIMTPKPLTSSQKQQQFKRIPVNLGVVQQEQKISDEERFSKPKNPDTVPSTSQNRSARLNEII